jgi:hypothetical protein
MQARGVVPAEVVCWCVVPVGGGDVVGMGCLVVDYGEMVVTW